MFRLARAATWWDVRQMAMEGLAQAGVDLLLAGHLHLHHTGLTAQRYQIEGHSALVVQAGTTISTRGRGEANSFNLIRIERPKITIEHYVVVAGKSRLHGRTGRAICPRAGSLDSCRLVGQA